MNPAAIADFECLLRADRDDAWSRFGTRTEHLTNAATRVGQAAIERYRQPT